MSPVFRWKTKSVRVPGFSCPRFFPGSSNAGRFGYTGQMWLPETGLYHYKARAYNPELGRFMQTDPIGVNGGMNIYAYVGGDPVNFTDPLGLAVEVLCTRYYLQCPFSPRDRIERNLGWTSISHQQARFLFAGWDDVHFPSGDGGGENQHDRDGDRPCNNRAMFAGNLTADFANGVGVIGTGALIVAGGAAFVGAATIATPALALAAAAGVGAAVLAAGSAGLHMYARGDGRNALAAIVGLAPGGVMGFLGRAARGFRPVSSLSASARKIANATDTMSNVLVGMYDGITQVAGVGASHQSCSVG